MTGTRRGAESPMVPDASFRSYYGRPILNQPVWRSPDIPGYLYLGGLAGASSVMALAAGVTQRPQLARSGKVAAAGAVGLSLLALVHDLGRPARFLNMLRVFKPTSPMSVGSWILAGYAPMAAVAAASELTGLGPGLGNAATLGAAVLGPALASYTGALVSDTAVPAWHDGHRHMPYVFVGSAAEAAGGLALLATPVAEHRPARRVALAGAALEVMAAGAMERGMGPVAEAYRRGRAGRLMRLGRSLSMVGAAGAVTIGRRNRTGAGASGVVLMAASACTKWGVFEAGLASARDPRDTVVPQLTRPSGLRGGGGWPGRGGRGRWLRRRGG